MREQLHSFKEGYDSQNLARFILNKFCFLSEPLTITDDIGTDFFCTYFDIIDKKYCVPKSSFAIQIKSENSSKSFDITSKMNYLFSLEVPYFIGIVNRDTLSLDIFSTECLNHFFSMNGNTKSKFKKVQLVDSLNLNFDPIYKSFVKEDNENYYLQCQKIVTLNAYYNYKTNPESLEDFFEIKNIIQKNIFSRLKEIHYYDVFGLSEFPAVYSGSGSFKHFQNNFLTTFIETLINCHHFLGMGLSGQNSNLLYFVLLGEILNKTTFNDSELLKNVLSRIKTEKVKPSKENELLLDNFKKIISEIIDEYNLLNTRKVIQ